MAQMAKKIYLKNSAGTQQTCNLYSTTGEVGAAYAMAVVDNTNCYVPLVATNAATATSGRVFKNNTTYAMASTAVPPYNYSFITAVGGGTFTVPAAVTKLRVTCVGGGAGCVVAEASSSFAVDNAVAGIATSFGNVVANGATKPAFTVDYDHWDDGEGCSGGYDFFIGFSLSFGTTNGVVGLGDNVNNLNCHAWTSNFIAGAPAVTLTNYKGVSIGSAGAGAGADPGSEGGIIGGCTFNTEGCFATGGSGYKVTSVISVTAGQQISYSIGNGGAGQRQHTVTYTAGYGSYGKHVWPGSSGAILVEWGQGIQ